MGPGYTSMYEEKNPYIFSELYKNNIYFFFQIRSLKDIVSITKNLLGIRNVEVENMQKDLTALQDRINAEKERHNKMIETINDANK